MFLDAGQASVAPARAIAAAAAAAEVVSGVERGGARPSEARAVQGAVVEEGLPHGIPPAPPIAAQRSFEGRHSRHRHAPGILHRCDAKRRGVVKHVPERHAPTTLAAWTHPALPATLGVTARRNARGSLSEGSVGPSLVG